MKSDVNSVYRKIDLKNIMMNYGRDDENINTRDYVNTRENYHSNSIL